jgi:hypothetical protein
MLMATEISRLQWGQISVQMRCEGALRDQDETTLGSLFSERSPIQVTLITFILT